MTTRSDLQRLAASLGVLGTELESKGLTAWDRLEGWEPGPATPPATGVRGGGGGDAAAEDRKAEMRSARRAGQQLEEWRVDLTELDQLVQRINRRLDMACPPDVSELRNRRTGDFDPETATDMLAAGWCPNCWLAGLGSVPLSPAEGKGQVRRYSDRCRPCGDFRKAHGGLDKPKALVVAHAEGKRMKPDEVERIIAAARAAAHPKRKSKKKGKRAA